MLFNGKVGRNKVLIFQNNVKNYPKQQCKQLQIKTSKTKPEPCLGKTPFTWQHLRGNFDFPAYKVLYKVYWECN